MLVSISNSDPTSSHIQELTLYPWLMPLMNCCGGGFHVKRMVVELSATTSTSCGGAVGTEHKHTQTDDDKKQFYHKVRNFGLSEKLQKCSLYNLGLPLSSTFVQNETWTNFFN